MSAVPEDFPVERSAPVEIVERSSGDEFRLHGEGPTFYSHRPAGESEAIDSRTLAARLNNGQVYVRERQDWLRLLDRLRELPGDTDHYDTILEGYDE